MALIISFIMRVPKESSHNANIAEHPFNALPCSVNKHLLCNPALDEEIRLT